MKSERPSIYLDPAEAAEKKAERARRLNIVEIPRLRFYGFSLLSLTVFLYNLALPQFAPPVLTTSFVFVFSYCMVSWFLLKSYFGRTGWVDLGLFFLIADLLIFLLAIYLTGGEKSPLFIILVFRVADQATVGFRRAFLFCNLTTLSYLALLGYLGWFEHRPISLPVETMKVMVIYSAGFYISLPARTVENIRKKTASAIRLTRESILALKEEGAAREAAGKKLAESMENYRMLFEGSPLPTWVYDVETLRFLAVNEAATTHYGYTEAEFLSMTTEEIRPAEDVGTFKRTVRQLPSVLKQNVRRHKRKSGELIDMEINSYALIFAGRPARLVVANDITERRRIEKALEESEDRYRDLVENSEDLILTHDLDGVLLSVNQAMSRRSGYSQEELLGTPVGNLILDKHREDYTNYLRQVRERGRAHGTMRLVTKTGEVRVLEYDSTVRREGLETPIVRSRAFDVTEQILAQQALRESEARFRVLFENSMGFICTHDLEGNLLSINPAGAGSLGYRPEDMVGVNLSHYIAPAARSLLSAYLQEIRKQETSEGLIRLVTKDGKERVWEYRNCLYRKHGGAPYVISYAQDITEHQEAVKAREELISLVSHELRTPLTSIKGSLNYLAGPMRDQLPERAWKLMSIASRSSDRMLRLINDLLNLEKIESGKMQFRWENVDLAGLLKQAVESTQSYADQFQVRLVLGNTMDGITVKADEDRLMQVLLNLLSNASKFSRANSDVTVTMAQTNGSLRVEIADQGVGIPEEFQKRIFERFAQAAGGDPKKEGSGLGLCISKAIIERHGGILGFHNRPGQGATFFFDLPLNLRTR